MGVCRICSSNSQAQLRVEGREATGRASAGSANAAHADATDDAWACARARRFPPPPRAAAKPSTLEKLPTLCGFRPRRAPECSGCGEAEGSCQGTGGDGGDGGDGGVGGARTVVIGVGGWCPAMTPEAADVPAGGRLPLGGWEGGSRAG